MSKLFFDFIAVAGFFKSSSCRIHHIAQQISDKNNMDSALSAGQAFIFT
jgi:hypothetical protein